MVLLNFTLVNRGEWLLSPANFKGAKKKKKKRKKDAKIYVGRSTTVHNLLHELCNRNVFIGWFFSQ